MPEAVPDENDGLPMSVSLGNRNAYIPVKNNEIDEKFAQIVNNHSGLGDIKIQRLGENSY